MRVGIYARVSTDAQEARGTIGSQLEALRGRVAADGDELVGEYIDDGISGARLDRPGLDALRDAAEAGLYEVLWCLTPDRLSRSYAYQVLITDELARHGVAISYLDAPDVASDPQARLLTQVQAVIAEYERAKITERSRRGKLFRARAGEAVCWRAPYGYVRVPRSGDRPAHLLINEGQAAVVRRIFDEYVAGGRSIRQITVGLNNDGVPSAAGGRWATGTVGRLLRREVYVGRLYLNRTKMEPRPGHRARQVRRPKEEWVLVPCPAIIDEPPSTPPPKPAPTTPTSPPAGSIPTKKAGFCEASSSAPAAPAGLPTGSGAPTAPSATTNASTATPSKLAAPNAAVAKA